MAKIKRMRALKETYKIFNKIWEEKLLQKPIEADKYEYLCPCCQYVCDRYGDINEHAMGPEGESSCTQCPLIELWPDGCETSGGRETLWERWNDEKDPADAKEIADFCLKLILK